MTDLDLTFPRYRKLVCECSLKKTCVPTQHLSSSLVRLQRCPLHMTLSLSIRPSYSPFVMKIVEKTPASHLVVPENVGAFVADDTGVSGSGMGDIGASRSIISASWLSTVAGRRPAATKVGRGDGGNAWNVSTPYAQSPKSPIPDLSFMPSNDVSCPYEHL
jgi:hypothetical protein